MTTISINTDTWMKAHWSEQDKRNASRVVDFVRQIMNEHNFEQVEREYGDSPYMQHNRNMEDGIFGVLNYMKTLTQRFPDFAYEIKNVLVDGDYVVVHSHATMRKQHRGDYRKGFNIVDKWRLQDGMLAEHWDAIQPLDTFMRFYYWLTGGAIRNGNTPF